MRRRLPALVTVLAGVAALAGCATGPTGGPSTPRTSTASASVTAREAASTPARPAPVRTTPVARVSTPSPDAAPATPAQVAFATMSLRRRVGQLFMVDCPSSGPGAATVAALRKYDVGSVILDGNSDLGVVRTGAITAKLQRLAGRGPKLFVATDQEGGLVQRLRGPGFVNIPSALQQGNVAPKQLRTDTTVWAGQLHAAGVNVDLAPVMDTVPAGFGPNPPIGDLRREYGHTPGTVSAHGVAVLKGLAAAGVLATAKHFPGLGRVSENTDTTSGVRDTVTTADDAYLRPFQRAIAAGVPFVMMSTAIYTRLDPSQPAAFSHAIVTGLLRHRLGFTGVVISDDLGAAKQVGGYSVGSRAVRFIAAGGDMVLTVDASQTPTMEAAVLARAKRDPGFRAQVDAAALHVLRAKQAAGLLG